MATLPIDPPPSSVELTAEQPTAKSRSINGMGTQARSSGVFLWRLSLGYSLLEFDQRDKLMAFLISQRGRFTEFDVTVPTHSESAGVSNSTATSAATYAIGEDTITLDGMTGALSELNLIRLNGQKATYAVVSAGANIAGSQQITIMPPLRTQLAISGVVLTKNVTLNMTLDSDSISTSSSGMASTIKFDLVEEVL